MSLIKFDGVTTVFIYSFASSHDLISFHAGNLRPCLGEKGVSMAVEKQKMAVRAGCYPSTHCAGVAGVV